MNSNLKKKTMTEDRMALVELIEQGADNDLVREMLAFAAERMMDLEIEAKTSVPCGSRSPESPLWLPPVRQEVSDSVSR